MSDDRPPISADDVKRLARLASLELGSDEVARLVRDLDSILGHVRELAAIDLEGVPPTAHVMVERMPLRADEPRPSLSRELALREAPRVEHDGFAVPTFVDEG